MHSQLGNLEECFDCPLEDKLFLVMVEIADALVDPTVHSHIVGLACSYNFGCLDLIFEIKKVA